MFEEMRLQAYDEHSGEYGGEYVLYFRMDEWSRWEREWTKKSIELAFEESRRREEEEKEKKKKKETSHRRAEKPQRTHFATARPEGRKPAPARLHRYVQPRERASK